MGRIESIIGGLGLGVAAMYFWDPNKGHGRRAQLRLKLTAVKNAKLRAEGTMLRDTRNRLKGITARAAAKFKRASTGDEQLIARIRSEIGHVISHPKSIKVQACDGTVRLSGPVFTSEVQDLVKAVWDVPGVKAIEHQLEEHIPGDNLPELQGEYEKPDRRPDFLKEEWKPATALVMGLAGGALAVYGLTKRGVPGTALGAVGLGLLAKSFRDSEGRFILGALVD